MILKTLSLSGAVTPAGTLALPSGALAQADPGPTVTMIQERGSLLGTGHNKSYLCFAEIDDRGNWSGFDIESCRALATAILDSPEALRVIPVSWAQRFPALQSGSGAS